jgi:Ca2+-binding RTX toxin-like protein
LVLLAALCATAGGASAVAAPTADAAAWQCRASALSTSSAGNPPSEPLVANSGFTPCVDSQVGAQDTGSSAGVPPGSVRADTASAATSIDPDGAAPAAQTISAVGRVEGLTVVPGAGAVTFGVREATARVTGACAAGTPVLAGAGEVAGMSVNGAELPLEQAVAQLSAALAPLGQVVDLEVNEQVRGASTLTHRALHLRVLDAAGTTLTDVIAGEARGGFDGAVCQDTGVTGSGPGTGSGTGNGTGNDGPRTGTVTQACPTGSVLDATSGFCVIRVAGAGVAGARVINVGRPFEGPSGGTVVALEEARKRYKSPCLSGAGPRFAVIGTNRADRITGTNRADRILLLGGKDRGDGGRGNDCLDGGTGRDVISGAQDRDRVYGMAGNDSLNGGPSTDHLSGGTGNDTINAAYGADRVLGGPGRDAINVATAGPRARVSCGGGRDTVRLNGSERRTVRGCERRLILPDRRTAGR